MKTFFISGLIEAYITIVVGDNFAVETFKNYARGKDSKPKDFFVDHKGIGMHWNALEWGWDQTRTEGN